MPIRGAEHVRNRDKAVGFRRVAPLPQAFRPASPEQAGQAGEAGPSAPTPCLDWAVEHLVGKNLVFVAVLEGDAMPRDPLVRAYREFAVELLEAFGQPGVLDRSYQGPLGAATGTERLKIRMYDLLAHGWDVAHALGRTADLPEDAAEEALAFARADGRAVRPAPDDASAVVRLVAFLGRDVTRPAG
jgi:uncharacterized protein (TIGR03086 family)